MAGWTAKILLVALAIAVSGCRLISDQPLLDATDGITIYPDSFVLAVMDDDGSVALDENARPKISLFNKSDNFYVATENGVRSELSFHKAYDHPDLFIAQYAIIGKKTVYGLARASETSLAIKTLSLDDNLRSALKNAGHNVLEEGLDTKVVETDALHAAINAYLEKHHADVESFREIDLGFTVGQGDIHGTALLRKALAASCLAKAGHPYDAAMKTITKKFRSGLWLDDITASDAQQVCRTAMEVNPIPSVRYAYARTLFLAEDYAAFKDQIKQLRQDDFPLAHVFVADTLIRGIGTEKDEAAALAILEENADKHPVVRHFLGQQYVRGPNGDPPDHPRAAALFESAMKDGFEPSRVAYAKLQQAGLGVPKDPAGAFRNFEIAAQTGVGAGAMETGRALYQGTGVGQNRQKAYAMFETAIEHHIAEAYYYAGFMKSRGQGTQKDEKIAVNWFEKAARKGIVAASGELGRAFYHGNGVKADKQRGLALLKEAANAGDENAKAYLEEIENPFSQITGIPDDQRKTWERLSKGEPFKLTDNNIPFMAGLAAGLMSDCGSPEDIGEKAELTAFVTTALSSMAFGSDYSNPNIGKGIASMTKRATLQAIGERIGREVPCGDLSEDLASNLAAAIKSDTKSADGGETLFVSTCQSQFSKRQCQCLADTGRVVIPDMHRRRYDRSIIKDLIQRNPLIALQVGLTCGITNY